MLLAMVHNINNPSLLKIEWILKDMQMWTLMPKGSGKEWFMIISPYQLD